MMPTVTSLIRIKNVAGAALIVAALCAVAFSAISLQPQDEAKAQTTPKGLVISKSSISTEEGVSTDPTFTIKLAAAPEPATSDVVISVTSGDTDAVGVTVDNTTLTWTTATDTSTTSTVTVDPQDDTDGADETVKLTISIVDASTPDTDYDELEDQTVTVNVADDDQQLTFGNLATGDTNKNCLNDTNESGGGAVDINNGDLTGDPVVLPNLDVPEDGSVTYCVKLTAEPTQVAFGQRAQIIRVSIDDSDNDDVSVNPKQVTFTGDISADPDDNTATDTAGTWNVYQPVKISALADDDDMTDTEVSILKHTATGGGYSLTKSEITGQLRVDVRDDDKKLAVTKHKPKVVEGETVNAFSVWLAAAPDDANSDGTLDNVTITAVELKLSDGKWVPIDTTATPADVARLGTISNASATVNATTAETVVAFTPAIDYVKDRDATDNITDLIDTKNEDETIRVRLTATGGGYGTAGSETDPPTPRDVEFTIVDIHRDAGVTIDTNPEKPGNQNDPLTVDEGMSKTYTVVLDAPPATTAAAQTAVTVNIAIAGDAGGVFVDTDTTTKGIYEQALNFRIGSPNDDAGTTEDDETERRWFTPQTVTVIGQTDSDTTDDMVTLNHSVSNATDETAYGSVTKPADVKVTVADTMPKKTKPAAGSTGQIDIRKITPSVKSVTVSAGDTVRLMVNVYALENLHVQKLADPKDVIFAWTANDVAIPGTDREEGDPANTEISYTAPSSPGTYTVKAKLDPHECLHSREKTDDNYGKDCTAEFEVKVRRSAPAAEPTAVPVNPLGEIPEIISGNDGKQYEVFTPVEGGTFDGDSHSITAGSGIVPSGEYIGVRMDGAGSASNAGMTAHRYTLVGDAYMISVADSAGEGINSYALNGAAKVCLPLPAAARSNISDIALVVKMSDGSLQVLSGTVRIAGASGPDVCGHVSSIPATVAVGTAGAPAAFTPTPEPTSTPEPPETGGAAPSNGAPLALLLILGIAAAALGTFLLAGRRPRQPSNR